MALCARPRPIPAGNAERPEVHPQRLMSGLGRCRWSGLQPSGSGEVALASTVLQVQYLEVKQGGIDQQLTDEAATAKKDDTKHRPTEALEAETEKHLAQPNAAKSDELVDNQALCIKSTTAELSTICCDPAAENYICLVELSRCRMPKPKPCNTTRRTMHKLEDAARISRAHRLARALAGACNFTECSSSS